MEIKTRKFYEIIYDGYSGKTPFKVKELHGVATVTLGWVLNNARHAAEGREYSPEGLSLLGRYISDAKYQVYSGKKRDASESADIECGNLLALCLAKVARADGRTKADPIALFSEIEGWLEFHHAVPFIAKSLTELMDCNFASQIQKEKATLPM